MVQVKRAIAIVAVILMLGMVTPRPAGATSATDIVIIAAGAIVAYVLVVMAATLMTRQVKTEFTMSPEDVEPQLQDQGDVRFVQHCRQTGPNVTIACW